MVRASPDHPVLFRRFSTSFRPAATIKTPFQVFRAYSKTALAGVILVTVISEDLNGIMVLGWAAQTFNL
jgi:hypothetical protein